MSYDSVRVQHAEINRAFEERYDELSGIVMAVKNGLKSLVAEHELDEDSAIWAMRSLDCPTLFRFYKKHKWDKDAAVSALVKNAVWRSNTIRCLTTPAAIPLLRFSESRDRLGRPILIVRGRLLSTTSTEDLKNLMITIYETGRLHLAHLYSQSTDVLGTASSESIGRVLQLTLVADLQGLGLQNVPMDLIPWIGQTIVPNYPGIIGPCYVINYSWAYNGLWQMCKRLLPQRAIARIFFPSHSELHEHIPRESLLEEHGGPPETYESKHDPLLSHYFPDLVPPSSTASSTLTSFASTPVSHSTPATSCEEISIPSRVQERSPSSPPSHSMLPRISTRSHMNTYFGYPVVHRKAPGPNQTPQLAAGRRRKRDLAKTLFILLIQRLTIAIPNLFLEPAISHSRNTGLGHARGEQKRRLRTWVWWTLCFWLAASLRKVLRIRNGAIVNGVVNVDGRLRNMGISLLVGGEFLRRLWVSLNLAGVMSKMIAPAVPMLA